MLAPVALLSTWLWNRTDGRTAEPIAARNDLIALELRLIKWTIGTGVAVAGAVIAAVAGMLRLLG